VVKEWCSASTASRRSFALLGRVLTLQLKLARREATGKYPSRPFVDQSRRAAQAADATVR
jgi:hypothetical protein